MTQQQGVGVAGDEVAQLAGAQVQPGQDRGHEPREHPGRLHLEVGLDGERREVGDAPAAGVADRADGQGGRAARGEVVPDAVEHRHVRGVEVHDVVVAVARDAVVGLEQRRDADGVGGEGARRDQLPEELGGHRQRSGGAEPADAVAVGQLGDRDVPHQPGQRPAPAAELEVVHHLGSELQAHHPGPLRAVEHRHPQHPAAVVAEAGDELAVLERAPGEGPLHRLRRRGVHPHRGEHPLTEVDQQHVGVEPEGSDGLVEHGGQALTDDEVGPIGQRREDIAPRRPGRHPEDPTRSPVAVEVTPSGHARSDTPSRRARS